LPAVQSNADATSHCGAAGNTLRPPDAVKPIGAALFMGSAG